MRAAPKYIFVTGGVVSSLGKGIAAALMDIRRNDLIRLAVAGYRDDRMVIFVPGRVIAGGSREDEPDEQRQSGKTGTGSDDVDDYACQHTGSF